ncbi:DUF3883 domain-containing protein [Holdemanella biformis]|uniref:DUF3883 domain-containing protein n=1 Tax=Holdemanella porci TaxID=2652276 RepID=A0A6N7VIE4_9FIRM|nr:DUF3883 domain-containing protein [Holdemanella porci]MSS56224.1 DUF3883 domain-containing protein [Holdemanella porci]
MIYNEFNLSDYKNNYRTIEGMHKCYGFEHNGIFYSNNMVYEKIEIFYKETNSEHLISSVDKSNGKPEIKALYINFITNINKFSKSIFEKFLDETTDKYSVFTEAEVSNMDQKRKDSTRIASGKTIIDGKIYYVANNLNQSEYIYSIFNHTPDKDLDKIIFRIYSKKNDSIESEENEKFEISRFINRFISNNEKTNISFNITLDKNTTNISRSSSNSSSHPKKSNSNNKNVTVDFDHINKVRIEHGDLGEFLIKEYEINQISQNEQLTQKEKSDLTSKVIIVSNDTSLGYDIVSIDTNGKEKHIEVKTTTKNSRDQFYLSKHEFEVSKNDPNYYIYRLYNLREENGELKANLSITKSDFLESDFDLEPSSYIVKTKKSNKDS